MKVYKKVQWKGRKYIAVLKLPSLVQIMWDPSDVTAKHRASKVKVLGFETLKGKSCPNMKKARGTFDPDFVYHRGKVAKPKYKFSLKQGVCESGIHFFVSKQKAKKWAA